MGSGVLAGRDHLCTSTTILWPKETTSAADGCKLKRPWHSSITRKPACVLHFKSPINMTVILCCTQARSPHSRLGCWEVSSLLIWLAIHTRDWSKVSWVYPEQKPAQSFPTDAVTPDENHPIWHGCVIHFWPYQCCGRLSVKSTHHLRQNTAANTPGAWNYQYT